MNLAFLNLIVSHCCHGAALFALMDWRFRTRTMAFVWTAYVALSAAFSIVLLMFAPLIVTACLTFFCTVACYFLICIWAGEGLPGKKVFLVATYFTFFYCSVIVVAWISLLFGQYAPIAEIVAKIPIFVLAILAWHLKGKAYLEKISYGITTGWTTLAFFAMSLMLGVAAFTNIVFPPMQVKNERVIIVGSLAFMLVVFSSYAAILQVIKSLKEKGDEQNVRSMNWLLQSELTSQTIYVSQAKRYRHDMRHHMQLLRSFADAGDLEKIRTYLSDYEQLFEKVDMPAFSKNMVLNALLCNFVRKCDEAEVSYTIQCDILETLPFSDVDTCIIFGNAFENALDACRKCTNPFFSLHASTKEGMLYMRIENSVQGTVRFKDGYPISLKKSGGIGIRSMLDTLLQYGGLVDFSQEGERFSVKIILPL